MARNQHGYVGLPVVTLIAVLLAAALIGCASTAAPTAPVVSVPTAAATPSPMPATHLVPTPALTPSPAILAFPNRSEVDLPPGRYDSSPPFDIDFTFEIPDEGWQSAHLNAEFFDVMRFEGPDPRTPTRWIAWAHPETIIGETSRAASSLSPQEAADLVATKDGVDASAARPFSFTGLTGVMLDLTAQAPNTHIFGGPDGNFGMEPAYALRLGLVSVESDLLLVLCLAPEDELDAAWDEAQPILSSVVL